VAKARAGTVTRGGAPFSFASRIDVGSDPSKREFRVPLSSGLVKSTGVAYKPEREELIEESS
jgi:hypothetical protein